MKLDLQKWFGRAAKADESQSHKLAVAQLLLEIARADLNTHADELAVVRSHLAQAYGLEGSRLDTLMERAGTEVEQAVSLHDTVQAVNAAMGPEEKSRLIHALWQVAYADQRLDPYEEALLRRLADLLHVPHSVFIREKLELLGQQPGLRGGGASA